MPQPKPKKIVPMPLGLKPSKNPQPMVTPENTQRGIKARAGINIPGLKTR
jgi:hypothetical protein